MFFASLKETPGITLRNVKLYERFLERVDLTRESKGRKGKGRPPKNKPKVEDIIYEEDYRTVLLSCSKQFGEEILRFYRAYNDMSLDSEERDLLIFFFQERWQVDLYGRKLEKICPFRFIVQDEESDVATHFRKDLISMDSKEYFCYIGQEKISPRFAFRARAVASRVNICPWYEQKSTSIFPDSVFLKIDLATPPENLKAEVEYVLEKFYRYYPFYFPVRENHLARKDRFLIDDLEIFYDISVGDKKIADLVRSRLMPKTGGKSGESLKGESLQIQGEVVRINQLIKSQNAMIVPKSGEEIFKGMDHLYEMLFEKNGKGNFYSDIVKYRKGKKN